MVMKFALAMLVLGIVTYGVYSFTNKPSFDMALYMDQASIRAKVQSANIYPKRAYVNNSLSIKMVNASASDYAYLDVRWFRNGAPIRGVAGQMLDAKYTRKGNKIHAEVNLLGPDAMSDPVVLRPMTIKNSIPRITAASTALRSIDSDILYTRVEATDPDGDNLTYTYHWYRNGSEISGATKAVLPVANYAKGDEFYATIVAFDGEDETAAYKCQSLTIGSNAPVISSEPPSSFTPDRRYVYQVEADSPDPESLVYQLLKRPEGMTISTTGMVDWELPKAETGRRKFDVVIEVKDLSGGTVTQEFTLTLSGR